VVPPSEPGHYPKGLDELSPSALLQAAAPTKPKPRVLGWQRLSHRAVPSAEAAASGVLAGVCPASTLRPQLQALTLASRLRSKAGKQQGGATDGAARGAASITIVRAPLGSSAVVVLLQRALRDAAMHLEQLLERQHAVDLADDDDLDSAFEQTSFLDRDGLEEVRERHRQRCREVWHEAVNEDLDSALELYRALAGEDVAELLERSKWLDAQGQKQSPTPFR